MHMLIIIKTTPCGYQTLFFKMPIKCHKTKIIIKVLVGNTIIWKQFRHLSLLHNNIRKISLKKAILIYQKIFLKQLIYSSNKYKIIKKFSLHCIGEVVLLIKNANNQH